MERTIRQLFSVGGAGTPNGILYDLVDDARNTLREIRGAAVSIAGAAEAISSAAMRIGR